MSTENIPPTKISDEAFYWLIRYGGEIGNNVDNKRIAKLLDIKTNAANMQVTRAKKRLMAAGATLEMKDGGDEEGAAKGTGGAGKKRAASAAEEGLDGMMNPRKKAKGKKVKVEEEEERRSDRVAEVC